MDILKHISSSILFNVRLERIWKIAQIEFKKRYYNSILGLLWAFINPLLNTAVFYFVFTYVFKRGGENYAFLLLSGIIMWNVFTETTNKGIRLLNKKRYLFENLQFQNIDLYISSALSVMFGFAFNICAFLAVATIGGIYPNFYFLFLPFMLINIFLLVVGVSMILSVVFIYLKDIQQMWTIVLLFGFWTSGILARGMKFVEAFPALLYINPMLGIVMNFRNIIMFSQPIDWHIYAITMSHAIGWFMLGYWLLSRFSHKAIEKI